MSEIHEQALLEAPVEEVWSLIGDPRRHPEWWPGVIEVDGERFEEGSEYVQVTHGSFGRDWRTAWEIDRMQELREVRMHCTLSGAFAHWRMTEAQGGTFLDVTFGMEPKRLGWSIYDRVAGRRASRRWLAESLASLRRHLAVRV
jgi:hypothetical protein